MRNNIKNYALGKKIIIAGFLFILTFSALAYAIGENESFNWVLGAVFIFAWIIFFILIVKYFISFFKK